MSGKLVLSPYIKLLLEKPESFTKEDLSQVLRDIVNGLASEVQVASFLTALRMTGLDHKPEFIATAAKTILEFSNVIEADKVNSKGYIDIVGTGGDGQDTFNVSTSSAIVGAGMGLDICKHGGKLATSSSGAGDLMKYLGIDLFKVTNATTPAIVADSKFCFLFAPSFHPGMAKVAPIRSQLGIPTIFNILGPLLNPIPLRARIIGVYTENLGQVFAEAVLLMDKMSKRPIGNTMIVWGEVGLDEISPIGKSKVWKVDPETENISVFEIEPSDFGLQEHSLDLVKSGTPEQNAIKLRSILSGDFAKGDPLLDYILMNSAALAVVGGIAKDWKHGVELAEQSINSGELLKALDTFVDAVKLVN